MTISASQRMRNQEILCALRDAEASDFRVGQVVDLHPAAHGPRGIGLWQYGIIRRIWPDGDVSASFRTHRLRPTVLRLDARYFLPQRDVADCPRCGLHNPPHLCLPTPPRRLLPQHARNAERR